MRTENLFDLSVKEVLDVLKTSRTGLTIEEAERRLKKHGKNKLPEKKRFTYLSIALNQFKSPLVYILFVAAIISFFLSELSDAAVILFAVFLNTVVGFIQEAKAENGLAKLKEMIEHRSHVIRGEVEMDINSADLVPGDIVVLRAGDRIPADGRLLDVHELEVDESSLTGESIPVEKVTDIKDQKGNLENKDNMVYMGTSVAKGRGQMAVSLTGIDTKFGQIAVLLKETEEEDTPLQVQLAKFSRSFGIMTFMIITVILIIGLMAGIRFVEIFTVSVAVAVAAIPEGLLVALTVVLAIGMQRILKNGSLVRKLIAAETLGSTTVICTDKTGTITKGEMEVDHVVTLSSVFSLPKGKSLVQRIIEEEKHNLDHMIAIKIGIICNNAIVENQEEELENWRIHGDYTEKALLLSGLIVGYDPRKIKNDYERIDEIPFNSERKMMATLNKSGKSDYEIYAKGTPEEIITRSKNVLVEGRIRKISEEDLRFLKRNQNELSKKGLRVIAVAFKSAEEGIAEIFNEKNEEEIVNNLTFVGLIAIKDPIRPEAKRTIEMARAAGLKVVMITGDNRITAKTIALELGMKVEDSNILDGYELDEMSTKDFTNIVSKIKVYARVSPHHKSRIVDALQGKGEVVAMTGDGVNDAPALKSADIGIALGSGTEVAKETADIVLLDNNFRTIITAIEQGRLIFDNLRKVTLYLVSDSFSEVVVIGGSLLIGVMNGIGNHILPLAAAQILWINLITDSFSNAALSVEPGEKEIMNEPPRKKDEPLLNFEMKVLIVIVSMTKGLIALGLFYYVFGATGNFQKASTIAFTILAVGSLFYAFSIRSLRRSIFQKDIFSNVYLVIATIIGFSLQLFAIYNEYFQKILKTVPLDMNDWSLIIFAIIAVMFVVESIKYLFIIREKK